MQTQSSARPTTAFALFAAAVASAALTFGIVAIARREGRAFFAQYTSPSGHTVHTEATVGAKRAAYRFEKAVIQDLVYDL